MEEEEEEDPNHANGTANGTSVSTPGAEEHSMCLELALLGATASGTSPSKASSRFLGQGGPYTMHVIKKVLDERWRFILVEIGKGKELTGAVKTCKRCCLCSWARLQAAQAQAKPRAGFLVKAGRTQCM
jgi:hypothetical protein